MKRIALSGTVLFACAFASVSEAVEVAVIAPSVSTRMEARAILARLGWHETSLRDASGIIVVVRSMLFSPLSWSYASIKDLQEAAEFQLNISGENFHIYIYSITPDLGVTQLSTLRTRLTTSLHRVENIKAMNL